ncbi:MAG: DUF177 domain-containing protein [Proteobacteria bacterium]|nr:DUF177 domain-containing protein [Pseudomonadota bacterium]
MKIIIGEIPDTGALDVEFFEKKEVLNSLFNKKLESDFHFDSPVKGSFHISKEGKTIFVDLTLSGAVMVDCSRCLEVFEYPINEACQLTFSPHEKEKGEKEAELEEKDFERTYYDNCLDLDEILREETALRLPFNPTCKKDCKGLCSSCGKNLNEGNCSCTNKIIDRRLEILTKLKT